MNFTACHAQRPYPTAQPAQTSGQSASAKRDPVLIRPIASQVARLRAAAGRSATCHCSDRGRDRVQNQDRPGAYNQAPDHSAFGCARQRANCGRHGDGHRKTAKLAVPERLTRRSRGAGHWRLACENRGPQEPLRIDDSRRIVVRGCCGSLLRFSLSWSKHITTFATAAMPPG